MPNEINSYDPQSLQKGIRLYREQDFGAAIPLFDKAKMEPPLTNEMKEAAVTGFWFAGKIARDYYGRLNEAIRDLHEAHKLAVELGGQQRIAEIADDIAKAYALRDEKSHGRKK